ncbi:MAG TPA: hypothetical protein VD790_00235 [Thermoleophilaceae bacterium]|nr:hypothetical protein [Thermoleophilaceae bacterium]
MRRAGASAFLACLALVSPAHAQSPAEQVARALERDPVYVHPGAADRLNFGEQGQVRLAIVREAIGRVKVAVVPEAFAERAGGVGELAHGIDRALGLRGTLIVVAGPAYWALTSYPNSDGAANALRTAVNERDGDRLVDELVPAVERIGRRVDPGPSGDLGGPQPGAGPGSPGGPDPVESADDFVDDLGDAFRLGVLIVAAAIALPFVLFAIFLVIRARRRSVDAAEVREVGERTADDELVVLGDEIRELDLDTSMPNASRSALAEYEQAIARYDQANELLEGEPTPYRVQQAQAAIAAGRRHLAAARERLG